MKKLHSVSLIGDLCVGCTNCIKGCPTQAIRVRGGKATIYDIRCIDCAQCIRICPYHAKIAVTDTLEERLAAASGKVKVAIVSPAIFSQFENPVTRIDVLKAVRQLGLIMFSMNLSVIPDMFLPPSRCCLRSRKRRKKCRKTRRMRSSP